MTECPSSEIESLNSGGPAYGLEKVNRSFTVRVVIAVGAVAPGRKGKEVGLVRKRFPARKHDKKNWFRGLAQIGNVRMMKKRN